RKRSTAEADLTAMVGRLGLTLLCAGVLAGTALGASAGSRDPQKRHNPADQAWARAIRIQRADLGAGDWRVEPSSGSDAGAPRAWPRHGHADGRLGGKADAANLGSARAAPGRARRPPPEQVAPTRPLPSAHGARVRPQRGVQPGDRRGVPAAVGRELRARAAVR